MSSRVMSQFVTRIYIFCVLPAAISSYFDSSLSDTLEITDKGFALSYLDGTELIGNVCRDHIFLGNFERVGSFGCISPRHKSFMFSGESSGILGMGFPIEESPDTNLFWSITNNTTNGRLDNGNDSTPSKIFSLVIDKSGGGELQLGGYDLSHTHNARIEDAFDTPILTECEDPMTMADCKFRHFRISVDSIRLGLVQSASTQVGRLNDYGLKRLISAILPADVPDIYGLFMRTLRLEIAQSGGTGASSPGSSLFIGIGQHEVEIPYDIYSFDADESPYAPEEEEEEEERDEKRNDIMSSYSQNRRSMATASSSPSVCVISVPAFPELFVLGDVFLHAAVVIHNLTDSKAPFVKIIPKIFSWSGDVGTSGSLRAESGRGSNVDAHDRDLFARLPIRRRTVPRDGYRKLLARGFHLYQSSTESTQTVSSSVRDFEANYFQSLITIFNQLLPRIQEIVPHGGSPLMYFLADEEVGANAVSSVPLRDLMGIEYLAVIEVGHPLQNNISVIVDTGSGALALGYVRRNCSSQLTSRFICFISTRGLPVDDGVNLLSRLVDRPIFLVSIVVSVVATLCGVAWLFVYCCGNKFFPNNNRMKQFNYDRASVSEHEDIDDRIEMI